MSQTGRFRRVAFGAFPAAAMLVGGLAVAAAILVVGLATPASAQAQDGPTPPRPGDPVGENVSPHGGYSASTNFCRQCHSVHMAEGEYALMWKESVTATCETCHGLGGSGARSVGGAGVTGTASSRAVYTTPLDKRLGSHTIGAPTPPGEEGLAMKSPQWSYGGAQSWKPGAAPNDFWGPKVTTPSNRVAGPGTATADAGGLYCASCHTPHGTDYGQAVNTRKYWSSLSTGQMADQALRDWQNNSGIWWQNPTTGGYQFRYLNKHANGSWEVCTAVDGGGTCNWAQIRDAQGQLVSLFGYKLLTRYPNQDYSSIKSYRTDTRDRDTPKWCSSCHPSRVDTSFGGTLHNHPTGCLSCHGDPVQVADGSRELSKDFPHTSTVDWLLRDYPDALCTTSCHTGSESGGGGSLP
jgi:hypothetical protein